MSDHKTPECQICETPFSESADRTPRILTACGHTVCEECATKLLKGSRIVCPFDRIETAIVSVKSLSKNYSILQISSDLISNASTVAIGSSDGKTVCAENSTHLATIYCEKCDVDLCGECWKVIHVSKVLSSHQKSTLAGKRFRFPKCPEHGHNIADLVCETHFCVAKHKLMCHTCVIHGPHTGHKSELLLEKCENLTKTLEEALTVVDDPQQSIDKLKNYLTSITSGDEYQAAEASIRSDFSQYREICKRKSISVCTKLKIEVRKKTKVVKAAIKECEDVNREARTQFRSEVEQLLKMDKLELIEEENQVTSVKNRAKELFGRSEEQNPLEVTKCPLRVPQYKMLLYRFSHVYIDTSNSGDSAWIASYLKGYSMELEEEDCYIHGNNGFRIIPTMPMDHQKTRSPELRCIYFCDIPSIQVCIEKVQSIPQHQKPDKVVICVTDFEQFPGLSGAEGTEWSHEELDKFPDPDRNERDYLIILEKEDVMDALDLTLSDN